MSEDIDFDDETMVEMNGAPSMGIEPAHVLSPDYPAQDKYGRYDILGRLAVGGMAEVFLAREVAGHGAVRHIAVKRILPQIADDETFVEMFLDEARLAMRLNHPNICHIYDIGELDESYFIAMEWVNGVPFGKLIAKSRQAGITLPITVCVKIMAHVADALNYAHQARDGVGRPLNIVHRDCSPQNIMVRYDGVVKLLDFGIAKAATQTTKTEAGIVKGKFSYMSPEQCLGKPLDARSDIFAIGACLYEGLTGKPAFRRASDLDTMRAIVHEPVPSARLVRNDVPPRLDAILRRALAKDPAERFQTAGELYMALERFLAEQGEFVHAMHIGATIERLMPDAAAAGPFAPDSNPSSRALSLPESGSRPASARGTKSDRGGVFGDDPDLDTLDSRLPAAAAAAFDGNLDVDDDEPPTEQWSGEELPPAVQALQEAARAERAAEAQDNAETAPHLSGAARATGPSLFSDPTATLDGVRRQSAFEVENETDFETGIGGRTMLRRAALLVGVLLAASLVIGGIFWVFSAGTDDEGATGSEVAGQPVSGSGATANSDPAGGAVNGDPASGDPTAGSGGDPAGDTAAPTDPTGDEGAVAAPTTGTIEITSEPPGATVSLDDFEGTAPVTWDEVEGGAHTVTATLDGHEEATEEIEVTPGETTRLTITLAAAPAVPDPVAPVTKRPPPRALGLLVLDTDPRGTRAYYGRTPLGRTPLRARLPVGTVRLRLTTPDGHDHVRSVRINARGQSRAFLPLSH